jgi:hypothetical protein
MPICPARNLQPQAEKRLSVCAAETGFSFITTLSE